MCFADVRSGLPLWDELVAKTFFHKIFFSHKNTVNYIYYTHIINFNTVSRLLKSHPNYISKLKLISLNVYLQTSQFIRIVQCHQRITQGLDQRGLIATTWILKSSVVNCEVLNISILSYYFYVFNIHIYLLSKALCVGFILITSSRLLQLHSFEAWPIVVQY